MPKPNRTATVVLDESFLEIRAKLLEVAAALDRIDRVAERQGPPDDAAAARRDRLEQAARLLLGEGPERAAAIQMLFSRDYEEGWRQQMGLSASVAK